jgi:hypothetical protein
MDFSSVLYFEAVIGPLPRQLTPSTFSRARGPGLPALGQPHPWLSPVHPSQCARRAHWRPCVSSGKEVKHGPCCTVSARFCTGAARLCTIYFSSGETTATASSESRNLPGVFACPKGCAGISPWWASSNTGDDEKTETRPPSQRPRMARAQSFPCCRHAARFLRIQFHPCP